MALASLTPRCGITLTASSPVSYVVFDYMRRHACSRWLQENISIGAAKEIRVKRDIKLGRIQQPEDVAKLVSFLVSDEGEYITGQTIKTCGGASL